jgi:hypothetical protein
LDATADREEARVGEAVNLKVKVSGRGNIKTLKVPELPPLLGVEKYEPELEEMSREVRGQLEGSKAYSYVLVPKREGPLEIGELEFTYFDPSAESYRIVRSDPIVLPVLPGEVLLSGRSTTGNGVTLVGADVRHIKPNLSYLSPGGDDLHRSKAFVALQILPIAAFVMSIAYRRHRDRMSQDVAYARLRRAHKLARGRLKEARNLVNGGDCETFYRAVSRALIEYVGDKFNLSAGGLTMEQLSRELAARRAPEEAAAKLLECQEVCDRGRFAPSRPSREEMEATIELAEEIIVMLEKGCGRG